MYASFEGHSEVVKLLTETGAQVDLLANNGQSALMGAGINGHHEISVHLLKKGAKVNQQDNNGSFALMSASKRGHSKVAKLLLGNCADIDLQDKGGWSALMCACQDGHSAVANLLLKKGAKIDLRNRDGLSALDYASHGVAELLLAQADSATDHQSAEAKQPRTKKNEFGLSELMNASKRGNIEDVKALLKMGAQIDVQDIDGWSALMHASITNWLIFSAKLVLRLI